MPSLIITGSVVLAAALIEVDSVGSEQWLTCWPRLFSVGAEGARGMLSTIAGSMMAVVGITFSMTLMTLMLASSQYTSRILRNFMRDRATQIVLGVFAGIFAYCLIVLRTIRSGDEGGFVPGLAVSFVVVLAMGGIGVLIFFIHHIVSSIQASSIISEDLVPLLLAGRNRQAVPVLGNGYIQSVDNVALLRLAREHKTIHSADGMRCRRFCGPWHQACLARPVGPAGKRGHRRPAGGIQDQPPPHAGTRLCFRHKADRGHGDASTFTPSVNDSTTAVMCVDYLTAILARLVSRNIPSSHRYEEGELRVIAIGQTFISLAAESFDQIRGSAKGNAAIMLRMLGGLQTVSTLTASPSRLRALLDQVQWITELVERTLESPQDRTRLERRLARVREALSVELE